MDLGLFCRFEGCREKLRALAIVPRSMFAANRVVVGDRADSSDELVRRRLFDPLPLLYEPALLAQRKVK